MVVVVVFLIILFIIAGINQNEQKVTTISQSTLENVIEINELSTIQYVYNGIATAYDQDDETVRYYVAYEGNVTAGIDFNEIEIDVENEEKTRASVRDKLELLKKQSEETKHDRTEPTKREHDTLPIILHKRE